MKKIVVLTLTLTLLLCICTPASALTFSQMYSLLEDYEEFMTGTWELEAPSYASVWEGVPRKFTFDKTRLSVTADGRLFYQWSNTNFKGNGGEVLISRWMTSGRDRLGLVFTSNGITTIAYYLKVK